MRADRGKQRVGGRALAWIPVLLLVMLVEARAVPAQEPSGDSLATSPPGGVVTEKAGSLAPSASRGPDLVRVPPPSGHLSHFSPGATFSEKEAGSASSRGWWLGSTGIALVLAVCGAICVAARKVPAAGLGGARPGSRSGQPHTQALDLRGPGRPASLC